MNSRKIQILLVFLRPQEIRLRQCQVMYLDPENLPSLLLLTWPELYVAAHIDAFCS